MSISIPTRQVGKEIVSAVGYGGMGIGGMAYGSADSDEERFKILDKLYEMGCRNWDTASVYGDSEELIGKWFARTGKRSDIFLATKFGFAPDWKIRGDPEFVKEQIAISLQKLQTDYVDLYYQHRPDPTVPIEITVGAMANLVKEGKVKYLGLSECSPSTIRRAHAVHPISAIQVEYSPFEIAVEKLGGVIDTARELSIAIFAYSPTGRGLTTGRFRSVEDFPENDSRRMFPRFAAKNFPHILQLVETLEEIAKTRNATAAQVTIAWLLAQGSDIIPIPGSKQEKYVVENFEAGQLTLSEEEVKKIRVAVDRIDKDLSAEERYPPGIMEMSFVDTPSLEEWQSQSASKV